MCGRQFIPGHERKFPPSRPVCPECGSGMHIFKKHDSHTVFRCGRYPECGAYMKVENHFSSKIE
jgi:ssDNA-binding Zn-finger/Zn-ribbon topoisomerase 1